MSVDGSQYSDAQIRCVGWKPPMEELPVVRGILYLLGWFIVGWPVLALAGVLVAGEAGAIIGLVLVIPVGLYGYNRYLAWHVKRISADYARIVFGITTRLRGEV